MVFESRLAAGLVRIVLVALLGDNVLVAEQRVKLACEDLLDFGVLKPGLAPTGRGPKLALEETPQPPVAAPPSTTVSDLRFCTAGAVARFVVRQKAERLATRAFP